MIVGWVIARWQHVWDLVKDTPQSFRIGGIVLLVQLLVAVTGPFWMPGRICTDGHRCAIIRHELEPPVWRRPAWPGHLQSNRLRDAHRHSAIADWYGSGLRGWHGDRADIGIYRWLDRQCVATDPRGAHQHSIPGSGSCFHCGRWSGAVRATAPHHPGHRFRERTPSWPHGTLGRNRYQRQRYITVARLRGESVRSVISRELLPNATSVLMVEFALRAGYGPVLIGSLGFLGFGLRPPTSAAGG